MWSISVRSCAVNFLLVARLDHAATICGSSKRPRFKARGRFGRSAVLSQDLAQRNISFAAFRNVGDERAQQNFRLWGSARDHGGLCGVDPGTRGFGGGGGVKSRFGLLPVPARQQNLPETGVDPGLRGVQFGPRFIGQLRLAFPA